MWQNWSGQEHSNAPIQRPATVEALSQTVASASGVVRPVGAGHSFTPLIASGDVILDPSDLSGPLVSGIDGTTAWVRATARLHELSAGLADHGLAFRNLGDINVQSLAGAAATATHGTGAALPCISAEVAAARLVTADGAVLDTSGDPELTRAARVSLGLLGVMVEAQMTLAPRHNLRRRVSLEQANDLFDTAAERWTSHRNYEFFLLPQTGKGVSIRHDLTDGPETKAPMSLDEIGLAGLRLAARLRRVHPVLQRALLSLLMAVQSDEDFVGEAWKVLSSPRKTRFVEMEYHLPEATAVDTLRLVYERLLAHHPDAYFPIEVRKTAGDDAMLSPFQGGARVSVALHYDARDDHGEMLRDLEPLLREGGGRPHWGKLHSLTATELSALYPDYHAFCAVRTRLDPEGRFLSPAMARLFT